VTPATLAPEQLFDPSPVRRGPQPADGPEPSARRSVGGRPTLEDMLSRVWEGLHADGAADCPVCHGRMQTAPGGGRCVDCGASLT